MNDSIIRIMLKDEYSRTIKNIEIYKNEIASLPKGSIVVVTKGENKYIYLSYREDGKNRTKYVGKEFSETHKDILEKIKLRKYYEDSLKKCIFEKKEIELYLKVGEKLYG